jgi:hypothetical protein
MSKKNKQPERPAIGMSDAVMAVIPAVFVLGVRTVAGPCVHADGTAAACTMAGRVLLGLGAAATLLACMRLFSADLKTRRSFDLLLVVAGALIAVLPGTALSLCMMETMHCRAVMLPFARLLGAATIVCALVCEFTVDQEVPTSRKKRR